MDKPTKVETPGSGYVKWHGTGGAATGAPNSFEERVLSSADVKRLTDADSASVLKWNAANDHKIDRGDIALTDDQLGKLLAVETDLEYVKESDK